METAKAEKPPRIKFRTLLDRPETIVSAPGDKIYKWSFLDEKGKLQEDEKNIYEGIQSFKRQVDFKERIKRGEEIDDGGGLYMDTSQLGDGYIGLHQYLDFLVNSVEEAFQQRKAENTNGEDTVKNTETPPESVGAPTQEDGTAGGSE